MEKPESSKVVVDSEVARSIPTVYVNTPSGTKRKNSSGERISFTEMITYYTKKIINFFFDFLETTVVALSIFVVAYLFIVQPHEIKGNSMEPNFHNNEYILTDKISYRFSEPQRGDVIIFKAPMNPDVDYIKRIIGLPGDRLKVQNGSVYINGNKLDEPYLVDQTNLFPGYYLQEGVEITIPPEEYFAMGDNRPHSSDSREFGPIDVKTIIGKAFLRYWPITKFGLVPKVTYQ